MSEQTPVEELEGRALDAAVAEEVFGREVVGHTTCVHVEGHWSIHPGSDPTGWACHAETGPVYVGDWCEGEEHHERMRKRSRLTRHKAAEKHGWSEEQVRELEEKEEAEHWVFGHSTTCLEVVPCYSEQIAAAWKVVEATSDPANGIHWAVGQEVGEDGQWCADFWHSGREFDPPAHGYGDTARLAICRAALTAYRKASE